MIKVSARRGRKWLVTMAGALGLMAPPAIADDVNITTNQTSGLDLNTQVGTTARVFPGVTLTNNGTLIGTSITGVRASTAVWQLTNQGTVSAPLGNAITFGLGGTVINEGQITTGYNAVFMTGTGRVENAAGATITAGTGAIWFGNAGSVGTVINSGTITGNATTVVLESGGSVTNNATGIIQNTNGANALSIRDGTSREVINHGIIRASGDFYDAGIAGGGVITNSATGLISGTYNAIWSITAGGASTITNAGTLRATNMTTGGGAIEMQVGGSIDNSGIMEGTLGVDVTGGTASVINSGTITGGGGIAIRFAGGNDSLTLRPGSAITGSINGAGGTDTFTLDGATGTSATFNVATNVVTNFEQATKTGAGTWTLAGNSGAFIPAINVQQGRLNINGGLTALDLNVQSGAIIGGTGTADILNALAGSTVAPGNSIGTLTVATATFASGSTLEVELNPMISDLLEVTCTATINAGALVHVIPEAGTYTLGKEYLILRAGTRTGQFTGITDTSAFLEFALDHAKDPDEVWLRVTQVVNFPAVAQTPNQIATAQALQNLGAASTLGAAVAPLSVASALVAFDQLSGEIHTSVARTLIEDSRIPREAALDRVGAAFAAIDEMQVGWGRNVWARSIGSGGVVRTDGNAAALGTGTGGFVVGADGMAGDDLFLGLEAGVTTHAVSASDRSSTASAMGGHLGLYGGQAFDSVLLKFGASLSGYGIQTVRTPTFAGFTDTARAGYAAATLQAFTELSYVFELEQGSVEPFVRLAVLGHAGHGYAETGGASALSGNITSSLSALVTLGLNASTDIALGDEGVVEIKGTIGWEQHVGATPTATHAFVSGTPFTVSATGYGSGLVAEGSATFAISETTSLSFGLKGGLRSSGGFASALATFRGSF